MQLFIKKKIRSGGEIRLRLSLSLFFFISTFFPIAGGR
jgi:hypothetical protein